MLAHIFSFCSFSQDFSFCNFVTVPAPISLTGAQNFFFITIKYFACIESVSAFSPLLIVFLYNKFE